MSEFNLNRQPDLTDPATCRAECEQLARAMQQQQMASMAGTAMSGHPFPAQLYARCEQVFTAAAGHIARVVPAAAGEAPPPAPAAVQTPQAETVIGGRKPR